MFLPISTLTSHWYGRKIRLPFLPDLLLLPVAVSLSMRREMP